MGILDTFIVASCVHFSGTYNQACQKAMVAGTKQSGVEVVVNDTEHTLTKKADQTAKEYLGETSVGVVAGSAAVVKAFQEKAATVALPTFGLCSSFSTHISKNKSSLNLEWKF